MSATPTAMASPATSIGSPCPTLAPRLLSPTTHILPAAENTTPQTSCGITTHKEWVVPPRPKPGRKPATDTPPTKRKAQNRAAQRAFRERRAARVNELEDKLKEIADETATRDAEFQSQISQLTFNNSELAKENAVYKSRVDTLQRELETLQKVKLEPVPEQPIQVSQVASPTPSADYSSAPSPSWTNSAQIEAVLNDRAIDFTSTFARKRTAPKPAAAAAAAAPPTSGCNREGGCSCSTKRTTSPPPTNPAPKRSRPSSLSPLETDFTSYPRSPYTSVPDPCGFCSDGTPCVCAEVANAMDMEDSDAEDTHSLHHTEPLKLAPMMGAGVRDMLTPPASVDGDAYPRLTTLHPSHTIASTPRTPPPQQQPSAGGCPPGGCAQCKADPMSTLFCQSVNSLAREQASSSSSAAGCGKAGGCCGGSGACGGAAGGDIEGRPMQRRVREKGKTYIPASAAYQTLSRHKMWEQVEDLGTLVRPLMIQSERGKCPEVEVSSVRDVLKMLDLRFGRD